VGSRVEDLWFMVWGSGFRVWGSGLNVSCAWFRVQGSGCMVQGLVFRDSV
jgi:hypothetical protein